MHARKHCDRLRCPPDHSKGTFQQKKKKKIGQKKKKKKCPKVPEGGQNIMEMHFLMLFRGQNAQILLFRRKTAPQNAKIFSPDT